MRAGQFVMLGGGEQPLLDEVDDEVSGSGPGWTLGIRAGRARGMNSAKLRVRYSPTSSSMSFVGGRVHMRLHRELYGYLCTLALLLVLYLHCLGRAALVVIVINGIASQGVRTMIMIDDSLGLLPGIT